MNRFKFIIKNLFTLYNILIIIACSLASLVVVIAFSVLYTENIFDFWIATPFTGLIGFFIGLEIAKLNNNYTRQIEYERRRARQRVRVHDMRETIERIVEAQNRLLDLLEDIDESKKKRNEHPDDTIISTIDDLYE